MSPRPAEESVAALFAQLRRTGSPAARTELIERHLPLARRLASRYRYTPQPLDDLVQVARLALVKAVDGYDPERGTGFAAFAVPTILGELKRHMRDTGWAVHVPRTLKDQAVAVERAERRLSVASARPPTVSELALEAGLSTEQVLEALAVRLAHDAAPFDSSADDAAPASGEHHAAPDSALESAGDRLTLDEALARLPARERAIIELRFTAGLTQSEIAERVGLSQVYVSRLLRATLAALREDIGGD